MIFQYELKDNSLRVMVPKELDHHSSIDLRSQTDMLLQTYHVKNLVFDFKDTEFMDSSGIGMIDRAVQKHGFYGWRSSGRAYEWTYPKDFFVVRIA